MDATGKHASKKAKSSRKTSSYSSRPGALVWFFRKSRDQWKDKCKDLKTLVKKFKNRVADLTKSRDKWKLKAEQSAIRIAELNSQLDSIRAEITSLREENTTLKKKK
jgi:chromosome segregation ATPase